jgi:2-dehydropantoate 2-reductase
MLVDNHYFFLFFSSKKETEDCIHKNRLVKRRDQMNIVIVGAGAMGSRVGSALYKHDYHVQLIDDWEEHVEAIQQNGLMVINEKGKEQVYIPAHLPKDCAGEVDLLIILTKSTKTDSMMKSCLHLLGKQTQVLTLQNGLGNIEILTKYVSKEQLFVGVTTYSAKLSGPGMVEAFGSGKTEIMNVTGQHIEDTERMIQIFNHSGIHATISENVIKSIWNKVAFNSVMNPLCTLTKSSAGVIGTYSHFYEIIDPIIDEIIKVAEVEGIELNKKYITETIIAALNPSMSGSHLSSMYQDIQRGEPTEIEFLNGALLKKGEHNQFSMPYNQILYHLIKMLEKGNEQPSLI